MRILLVEDDEVLAETLLQSLSSQHYIVDAVDDGQNGVGLCPKRRTRPDFDCLERYT